MDRRVLTALTMTVLLVLLAGGGYVGWRSFNAAPEDDEPDQAAPRCDNGLAAGEPVTTRDITVSVFNAGDRAGLASQTLARLEQRGFIPGDVGNAPEDLSGVRQVRVLAPARNDSAARLVALQFGRDTRVQRYAEDLGPGIEVIVGNEFRGLADAPRRIRARGPTSGC